MLKIGLLLWKWQFGGGHLVLTVLWWAGVVQPPAESLSCASDAVEITTNVTYQTWYNVAAPKPSSSTPCYCRGAHLPSFPHNTKKKDGHLHC